MIRRPPRSTLTDTLVPYTTLFRSIIGDHDLNVAKLYGMLPTGEAGTSEGRTAATNQTVRTVFLIGPDKLIKAMLLYPMSSGRTFDEVLRLLDSCQLTARHKVATPVNRPEERSEGKEGVSPCRSRWWP